MYNLIAMVSKVSEKEKNLGGAKSLKEKKSGPKTKKDIRFRYFSASSIVNRQNRISFNSCENSSVDFETLDQSA